MHLALFKLNTFVLSDCGTIIDTMLVILRHKKSQAVFMLTNTTLAKKKKKVALT